MEKKLYAREWIAIFLILGFLASLCAISTLSKTSKEHLLCKVKSFPSAPQKSIEVEFLGAVKKPGVYRFRPGISVKEALRGVPLCKTADRRKIDLGKILYASQRLVVPEREEKRATLKLRSRVKKRAPKEAGSLENIPLGL